MSIQTSIATDNKELAARNEETEMTIVVVFINLASRKEKINRSQVDRDDVRLDRWIRKGRKEKMRQQLTGISKAACFRVMRQDHVVENGTICKRADQASDVSPKNRYHYMCNVFGYPHTHVPPKTGYVLRTDRYRGEKMRGLRESPFCKILLQENTPFAHSHTTVQKTQEQG